MIGYITISEPKTPQISVLELHKIRQLTDFETPQLCLARLHDDEASSLKSMVGFEVHSYLCFAILFSCFEQRMSSTR